jgi:DNA (cytosine-5)-methyltransferase 1
VPPYLARAVAAKIIQALQIKPHKSRKTLTLQKSQLLSFTMSQAANYYAVPKDTIPQRDRALVAVGGSEKSEFLKNSDF